MKRIHVMTRPLVRLHIFVLIIFLLSGAMPNINVFAADSDATPTPLPQNGSEVLPDQAPNTEPTPAPEGIFNVKLDSVEDRSNSLLVKWQTPQLAQGWIEYGADTSNLNQVAYDMRGKDVADTTHEVLVENVNQDTTYFFVIVVNGKRFDNNGTPFTTQMSMLVQSASTDAVPAYNTAFLSDGQLEDYNSMNVDQIRAFLSSYNSYFRQSILDVDGQTFDPPAVIAQAATQYRISPKVLLTTLQKESSGVTRTTRPSNTNLAFLMGCIASNTARQQLACAAERFRAYHDQLSNTGSTVSGWRVGVAKSTQDGVSVTPATKAVAGQFTYTPYAGVQWGGNQSSVGGVYLFYSYWNQFGFGGSNCLAESPHPYANNYNNTWTLTNSNSNATSTRIHFSRLETESNYDYVYVRDANNNQIGRFDGAKADVWSAPVSGRTVNIQLTSDGSVTAWGFCADRIETVSTGQAPAAPSNLRATALDSTRIQLNWSDNSSNETGFKVYDANTLVATLGANVAAYTVTGLAPSSYHCYAVYAYNSYGSAVTPGWACATTASAGQPPAAPSNLRATALDSTRIQLNWSDNSNNETGFKVYDANTLIATVGANVGAYTVTGLAPSSYHCYAVYAYNNYGSAVTPGWACATTSSGISNNLAVGRPAYATSQESTTYTPAKGNDGNTSTRWSSQWSATAKDEWWWVDLGSQTFDQVIVRWETAYASQYYICWTNDLATPCVGSWYTASSPTALRHNLGTHTARYVAILMRQRAPCCGNYSFFEFEIYRAVSAAATQTENAAEDLANPSPNSEAGAILIPQVPEQNIQFLPFIQQ